MVESDEFMPSAPGDPDLGPIDTGDTDEAVDPAETAVMEMPDDTPDESIGDDEVPTLDTDDDTSAWSPATPPSDEDEDWD